MPYKIATVDPKKIERALGQVAGPRGLRPMRDLTQLRLPAGGGIAWKVKTLQGDKAQEFLEGIIMHHHDARAFYERPFAETGGSAPDCNSNNGLYGEGTPGGDCLTCRHAQFGTAVRADGTIGRGQRCNEMYWVYILFETSVLPTLISIPATGKAALHEYIKQLSSEGMALFEVVTKIGLTTDKNNDGIEFATPTFEVVSEAEPAIIERLEGYADTLPQILEGPKTTRVISESTQSPPLRTTPARAAAAEAAATGSEYFDGMSDDVDGSDIPEDYE